jgi:hypothetical protein
MIGASTDYLILPHVSFTDPGVIRARLTGRSQWALRYTDGSILAEWKRDWSHAPRLHRASIRLYCPDGSCAQFGDTKDATGRLFQLHQSVGLAGVGRPILCHIIGYAYGTNGECQIAVWNYEKRRLEVAFDNVNAMAFGNIGKLSEDVLGLDAA